MIIGIERNIAHLCFQLYNLKYKIYAFYCSIQNIGILCFELYYFRASPLRRENKFGNLKSMEVRFEIMGSKIRTASFPPSYNN